MQETREGEKYNDDYITIEYQYDESGNKIQEKFNQVSPEYDEANTVVRQSVYDQNYIWEYDAEGKLTYYSFISSAAGKDVVANESEYLYDEQGVTRHFIVDGKSILFSTVSTPLRHLLFADRALLSTKLSSQIEIFRFKLCVQ